jgi:hypothetical protein
MQRIVKMPAPIRRENKPKSLYVKRYANSEDNIKPKG